jgi:bifunctional UDP-N-acetylglucosamine pyrophosphorylase/glucosamine-1-phosphate N-acetyltransferase
MPITAIVLAAGEGTRMKSRHPKVAHKLLDKPLVWWTVDAARKAGADTIIVVVGNGADEVRAIFADDEDVRCVEQTERLGTGHAVRCVRDAVGAFQGPTVVLYGDTPLVSPETIRALVDETRAHHNAATVLTMVPPDPTGYGRIDRAQDGSVRAIIEHKDCTSEQQAALTECNTGMYCFCGRRLTDNIDRIGTDNAQGEYYLTDMVGIYVSMGEPVGTMVAADFTETLGVNSRVQLACATKIMQRRINEQLMASGVTMLDPELVWIGPDVTIDADVELLPQTILYGNTKVAEDSIIGPNVRLLDVTVGRGCIIEQAVGSGVRLYDGTVCRQLVLS